eukprot:GHVU01014159.1.p1 GENE.GHVU01014159.1~~GHVU01014159.1.p1  ORF type:complete len:440 (+),score=36.12 GHVU01014159.1:333-1652(+)
MLSVDYVSRLHTLLLGLILIGALVDQVSTLDLRIPFSKIKRELHDKPDSRLHQRIHRASKRAKKSDHCTTGVAKTSYNQEDAKYLNSSNQTTGSVSIPRTSSSTALSNVTSSNAVSNVTSTNNLSSSSFVTSNTSDNSTVRSTQSSNSTSSNSALASVFDSSAMMRNDLYLGFLPDDGSEGGTRQTMSQLNADLGSKSAGYGWYAQAKAGTTFDGSQLLEVLDDVKACNCVFQPAVMPIGGWQGLTESDNSQAVAIANVMKKFTDEGIPVWLRFAHEVNYYQTDGTYQGTADDFKKGWAAVSAAVKSIAPQVKMWWTPNVASAESYAQYEPDLSTVDLVGIDYYPKQLTGSDFINTMKAFHDQYAVDGRMFAIGETGLGWSGSIDDRFKWLAEITAAKSSMPQFLSMSWFNYRKDYDYKVAGEDTLNKKFTSFVATQSS